MDLIAEALADGRTAHHNAHPIPDAGLPGQVHHLAHLLHGGGQQSRAGDDVAVMLPGCVNKFLRRHVGPQIIHLDIAALQHDFHQVFADVVHVAPDGTDAGRADGQPGAVGVHHMA